MEAGVLVGVGCVSAFVAAGILGARAFKTVSTASRRAYDKEERRRAQASVLFSRGFGALRPCARRVLRVSFASSWAQEASMLLGERRIEASSEGLCSVLLGAALFAFAAGSVIGGPACGLALCACLVIALRMLTKRESERRMDEIRDAVPEALRCMGVCFQAGFSLQQTLRQVAAELRGPLRATFEQSVDMLETGSTVSQALERLCGGAANELSFVAVALDIQHAAGGSMKQVLEAASDSLAADLELKRSMRVQTAQAKLSARVVSIMPFVLIAVFSATTEGFLDPFFQSAAGIALLVLAVLMQASGVLMVRRMLSVGDG